MYFNLSLVLNPLSVKKLKGLQFRGHLNTHIATLMKSLALQKTGPSNWQDNQAGMAFYENICFYSSKVTKLIGREKSVNIFGRERYLVGGTCWIFVKFPDNFNFYTSK